MMRITRCDSVACEVSTLEQFVMRFLLIMATSLFSETMQVVSRRRDVDTA